MAGNGRMQKGPLVSTSTTAAEVMVRQVKTVSSSMRVKDLIQFLTKRRVSGAPVVDETGKLAGVVSMTDIVKAQAHLEGKNSICFSFYEYDPFGGHVGYFEECSLKVLDMRVRELMTEEVITALPQEPLDHVIQRMVGHGIHRLIVAEQKIIQGVISTLDIMQALLSGKITPPEPTVRVAELMSEIVVSALDAMLIREVVDMMTEKGISGLPVTQEDGTVLGVISQADIVRTEAETDRRRHKYPDFYSFDAHMRKVPRVRDFDREVLERQTKELMNPRIISVRPEASVTAAARNMVAEQVHRLLVVDETGRIKGLIGTLDLIKALV
jgi:CBS domain-containing protein